MKVAVYAIALDEERFAGRWAESARGADYRVVADTGSGDGTVAALRAEGVDVHRISVRPWRFDLARNAALALVPADADACISLDLDEILVPGWREALERAWVAGTTRLRYHYVWNWDRNGKPLTAFFADRIHHRAGYAWKYPAHEVVHPLSGTRENVAWSEDVRIHHHADAAKSRGQYLDLLALAASERPEDPRCAHYYGRELMFRRRFADAIAELERHLSLPGASWKAERAASLRFIGRCQQALGRKADARAAFMRACAETPDAREPWFEFARFSLAQKDWAGGLWATHATLAITEMPREHTRDMTAWTVGPYDVGSICAYYAGQRQLARTWLEKALGYEPDNPRLLRNAARILGRK